LKIVENDAEIEEPKAENKISRRLDALLDKKNVEEVQVL